MISRAIYVDERTLLCVLMGVAAGYAIIVLAARRKAIRESEARFRALAEAIPQIVWTTGSDGLTTFVNRRWYEMTGTREGGGLGNEWMNVVHPDDRDACQEEWQRCKQAGQTFEVEYRLRDAVKGYRWYLDRAVPLRDSSGAIQQWFGTCTDIHDQMLTQQLLEQKVKEYTAALVDANSHLAEEMRERALAQQELNEHNERMLRDLARRSERATGLARMAKRLQACGGLNDMFSIVADMGPRIFPEVRGALLLLNPSRNVLETAVVWSDCQVPAKAFTPHECPALRSGLVQIDCGHHPAGGVGDAARDDAHFCVPLVAQGENVGIMCCRTIEPHKLDESGRSLASTFAEQIGLSIINIRLREALLNQSMRDPLTGLFNRRYLDETLEREIRRAVRSEHGLGILMLDLDHFKKFNDTFGHEAGDTVLRETASLLAKSVRAEDIVCRFGGEEFVIILPNADLKATLARGERICGKLREMAVAHQGQSLGTVTVSIGVASLPEHGKESKMLLESADAALYQAKREGRNRVVAAEPRVDGRALLDLSTSTS